MTLTLADVIRHRDLGIRMLTGKSDALDGEVSWVSSSDLADPTPFLGADQIILTTGNQFLDTDDLGRSGGASNGGRTGPAVTTDYEPYVERLARAGVRALGYGTEVIAPGTPPALVRACERHGLPLFEVPYRTPFIAIIRLVADANAAADHARELWAMNAQRAISFAALRPNALPAVLAELARLLGRWVELYASPGPTVTSFGRGDPSPAEVAEEATRLLARGQRSAATLPIGDERITLQTIGRRGDLRGVLVIGGTEALDHADQSVVTSVIALAGLALEQGRGLRRARRALRAGLLETLLAGNTTLTRQTLQQIHEQLPYEPVRVVLWRPDHGTGDPLLRELDARTQSRPGSLFFARLGREIIAFLPATEAYDRALELSTPDELHAGLSDPVGYAAVASGLDQARRALDEHEGPGPAVSAFADLGARDLLGLAEGVDAAELALRVLAPIIEHDRDHGGALVDSLATWLEFNGSWDPAARSLGLHRHTLKARIVQIEALTGENLQTMAARTNFWLALRAHRGARRSLLE